MSKSLQLLGSVVAIITAFAAPAMAQTVVIKAAPARAPIDLTLNSGSPQSATADEGGSARLSVTVPAGVDSSGVRFFIETCTPRVRVVMVTVGMAVPSAECLRTDIPWVFVMRRETSFLVDLEGSSPMVLVRQGSVPDDWMLRTVPGQPAVIREPIAPPTGLMVSGELGLGGLRRFIDVACGTAACANDRVTGAVGVAATYWFSPMLGAQVGFARPSRATASGSGTGFSFDTEMDTRVVTLAANFGGPSKRSRPYGQAGVNYHESLFSQKTTVADAAVTISGVPTIVPGGTQTSRLKTTGWGWLFGGGVEVWLTRSLAVYAEGQVMSIGGPDTAGTGAEMRHHLTLVMVGGRLHLWR